MRAGDEAIVERVELANEVIERLRYLNVAAGERISLLKVSLFKRTYLLQARSAKIAIGREVAEGIKICGK